MPEVVSDGPGISVDRAIGHYVDNFDADFSVIRDFYNSLPFEGKKPLNECRIHFSAMALKSLRGQFLGVRIRDSQKEMIGQLDPLTPKDTDILIFIGSLLASKSPTASSTLGHELIHYATDNIDYDFHLSSLDERAVNLELAFLQKTSIKLVRFCGGAAVWGGISYGVGEALTNVPEVSGRPSIWEAALLGIVLKSVSFYRDCHKRRNRLNQLIERSINLYRELPWEKDAMETAQLSEAALTLGPKANMPKILVRYGGKGNRVANKVIDSVHRDISLGKAAPPRN